MNKKVVKNIFVVSFFIFQIIISGLATADDSLLRAEVYKRIGRDKSGNPSAGIYFVWEPSNKHDFVYLPSDWFMNYKVVESGNTKVQDDDHFKFSFFYSPSASGINQVDVTCNKEIRDCISEFLKKDRSDHHDKSLSIDSYAALNPDGRAPVKATIQELKVFFSHINEITEKIKNDINSADQLRIYIYGNSLDNYKMLFFKNNESEGWIGWIDSTTHVVCEFYCKNPDDIGIKSGLMNNLLAINMKDASYIAFGEKVSYLTSDGIIMYGKKWDKQNQKEYYLKDENAFLYKADLPQDEDGWLKFYKKIVNALALSDKGYWSEYFRQDPLVPFKLATKD